MSQTHLEGCGTTRAASIRLSSGATGAVAIAIVLLSASPASAQSWPKLREPNADTACAQSLQVAEAAFRSTKPLIFTTSTVPDELDLTLAIKPSGRDISGGHALVIDDASVEEIPAATGKRRSVYWQREPRHDMRFALSERAFSWQGDWFELFAVSATATPTDLQAAIDQARDEDRAFPLLLGNEWRPPLLVRDQKSGDIWAIAVGPPYNFLNDWRIFAIRADGAKERCAIQFRPDVSPPDRIGKAWDLLPSDVRELAKLLDGTLGAGENEGTANPTARRRIEADHAWANAAMRPWVYTDTNTSSLRASVDSLLGSHWSRQAKSFERHYQKIVAQIPLAEAALSDRYRLEFGMSAADAAATAKAAIDTSAAALFGFVLLG